MAKKEPIVRPVYGGPSPWEGFTVAKRYRVSVKVVSQEGTCYQGHKVGDEWILEKHTPAGICLTAFNDLFPFIWILMWGGSLFYGPEPDVIPGLCCADHENPVVFELRRLPD